LKARRGEKEGARVCVCRGQRDAAIESGAALGRARRARQRHRVFFSTPPIPQAELVVLTKAGAATGVRLPFPFGAPALVGRAPRSAARLRAARPALALDNATVSAAHATLRVHGGGAGATVTDGGARNGTWVARRSGVDRGAARRVGRGATARVGHGDEILFGGVRTRLEVGGGVRAAPAPVPPAPKRAAVAGGAPPRRPTLPALPAARHAPAPRTLATPPALHVVRLSSAVADDEATRRAVRAAGLTLAPPSGPGSFDWGVLVAAPPGARGGGFTRSLNWLLAVAGGRPVAAPGWLDACAAAGRAVPVDGALAHPADDPAASGFDLAGALAMSARAPLLMVRIVAASPSLLARERDGGAGLAALVCAAGGTLAAAPPPTRGSAAARPASWLGLAAGDSDAERAWASRALPAGARVLSRSQFVEALLLQRLPAAGVFTAGR
jgi:hypothetical protein